MRTQVVTSLADVRPDQWDRLVGADDPMIEHGFLRALETSGSVGPKTGWQPVYILLWQGSALMAALAMYVKSHSYGEYIFDWSWAGVAERLDISYYPKLVSMVPFTPAGQRRILRAEGVALSQVVEPLRRAVLALARDVDASSVHLLFLDEAERDHLTGDGSFMARLSSQFHWYNAGYSDFEAYLARFRAPLRKQVRRERQQVLDSGLEVRTVEGPELSDREWDALVEFYLATCDRKGSLPYLRPAFFQAIRTSHSHRVVAVLAYRGGEVVAGTLNFQKGNSLYGRYWGCYEEHPSLHFELCYYRLIERAIAMKLDRFEAGAQGVHKLRRGLMPAAVHSVHWIRNPQLRGIIAEHLPREAHSVRREMALLAEHGPFRRG